MSLESLLAEDFATIMLPTQAKDGSAGPTYTPYVADPAFPATVPGRLESTNAMLLTPFGESIMIRKWTFFTQQAGIHVGHYIQSSDGILLRVIGINQDRQIGGMDEYYEIECQETKRT